MALLPSSGPGSHGCQSLPQSDCCMARFWLPISPALPSHVSHWAGTIQRSTARPRLGSLEHVTWHRDWTSDLLHCHHCMTHAFGWSCLSYTLLGCCGAEPWLWVPPWSAQGLLISLFSISNRAALLLSAPRQPHPMHSQTARECTAWQLLLFK